MRIRPRSRSRSRTCRRKIPRPAGSSRSLSWRPCASLPRRCASEPEFQPRELLVPGSVVPWGGAGGGPWAEAGTGLLESVGYVVIAVAVFDVAKYFVEEEVIRGREMRLASEARRSLTKFISTIAIAVFIEALVMVFRQGGQDIALILYPAAILVTGVLIILGLGVYQRLSADVESRVDAKDRAQDKQDKVEEKSGKLKKA